MNITIKQMIEELKKYPNQDAELNIITNVIDTENEAYDIADCSIEFMEQDKDDVSCYDVMVSLNAEQTKKRDEKRDDSITTLLCDNGKINITLNTNSYYENIVITNDNNEVLREIQVNGRFHDHENIVKILQSIL